MPDKHIVIRLFMVIIVFVIEILQTIEIFVINIFKSIGRVVHIDVRDPPFQLDTSNPKGGSMEKEIKEKKRRFSRVQKKRILEAFNSSQMTCTELAGVLKTLKKWFLT